MSRPDSILASIGGTPLIRLREVTRGLDAEILVKAEYLNPSGSIKDRTALRMVEEAEREGRLRPGDTIIEASTGNTAAGLAMVAAAKGYRLHVFAPREVASPERIRIVESFGASIEFTDTTDLPLTEGDEHGMRVELLPRLACRDLERSEPGIWWARQFCNPHNVSAHREGTGMEILNQTEGRLHAFVASVGSGSTLLGVSQALLANDPNVEIFGIEPAAEMPWLGLALDEIEIIPGINDGIVIDLLEADILAGVFRIGDGEDVLSLVKYQHVTNLGIACGRPF